MSSNIIYDDGRNGLLTDLTESVTSTWIFGGTEQRGHSISPGNFGNFQLIILESARND